MRLPLTSTHALALAVTLAVAGAGSLGSAGATARAGSTHREGPAARAALRRSLSDYRRLARVYERAALAAGAPPARTRRELLSVPSTPVRRSLVAHDAGDTLRVEAGVWERRAELARRRAVATLRYQLRVELPRDPRSGRPLRLVVYNRRLTHTLEHIFPGPVRARSLASASAGPSLRVWQLRAAAATLDVARNVPRPLLRRDRLTAGLLCIHRYEGSWSANTGNGYYGGLQMDIGFQRAYGSRFLGRWGTADKWPVWAQIAVARRAFLSGRGFFPWPSTARVCGLL